MTTTDIRRPVQLELTARVPEPLPQITAPQALAPASPKVVEQPPVVDPDPEPETPKIYSVAELVKAVSKKLEQHYSDIWVEGEISNLRLPSSGHAYFTLKDDAAQLGIVMFRGSVGKLKFRLEDGLKLRCRGTLAIYEAQGRFQMTATYAEPAGLGALHLAFEQLKRKLEAEGLFDAKHKKPLPMLPRSIAVVTSGTGAAVRDVIRVLHSRCPVRVIIVPTAVQGAEAPPEIVQALAQADALGVDLIIAGRGGGSLEDLWAFNTEEVARAIFAVKTPIISAVGHEIDVTIADFVADVRAPTPSAAAEMAVPVMAELRELMRVLASRLERGTTRSIRERALLLERVRSRLGSPAQQLNRQRQRLDDLVARSGTTLRQKLRAHSLRLSQQQQRLIAQQPQARLSRDRASFSQVTQRLTHNIHRTLEVKRNTYMQRVAALNALSPLAVLSRGYSLVVDEQQRVIHRADEVAVGQSLQVRLHEGQLKVKVVST